MSSAAHRHLPWGAEALWRQLEPLLPGISVEVVAVADSTNSRLIERARGPATRRSDAAPTVPGQLETPGRRAGDLQPALLVAEQQTAGRGRQGRPWAARPGASLTFSLALALRPADWSGLSLAVGAALADALEPLAEGAAPRLALKWPNDLFLADTDGGRRKLGGILIETVGVGDARMAVVGVGLNILPLEGVNAEGFSSGFACLREVVPEATAPATLAMVAQPLVRALQTFEAQGLAPFAAAYARRDLLAGRTVVTTAPGVAQGVAEGIDADGALRVRTPDGQVQRVTGGEVSVRLRPNGGA